MFYKAFTTLSAAALLALTPMAMAEDVDSAAQTRMETETGIPMNTQSGDSAPSVQTRSSVQTQQNSRTGAQTGLEDNVRRSWDNTKQAVSNTVDKVEYRLFGADPDGVQTSIAAGATAEGILDKPVYNSRNERVGTLDDIIVDNRGMATLAVVSDADTIDVGAKEVAFDYNMVLRRNQDGDVVMPLTEEAIENAQKFSYDMSDIGKADIRTMPANSYSMEKMLDADIVNPGGETVASVDNITLRNGRVDALIVGFDKILGMGGDKAALSFSEVKMVNKGDGEVDFQLTAPQAARFETFKQSSLD